MRRSLGVRLLAIVALATLLFAAAAASPPHAFPLRDAKLYLTADEGSPPGFTTDAPLLKSGPGASGQAIFFPVLGVVGLDQDSAHWVTDVASGASYTLASDTHLDLAFQALDVEALASFTASLSALDRAGHSTLLASQQRDFNLPRLLPSTESFDLPTTGALLPKGSALRLDVHADALDVLSILLYGGDSGSQMAFTLQLADQDRDGIPDDDDPCPTVPDCDADGTNDGDEPSGSGDTTFHQFYQSFYNQSSTALPPGVAPPGGAPGGTPPGTDNGPGQTTPQPPNPLPGQPGPPALPGRTFGRIETAAGGLTLATGTTLTSLAFTRRRP